MQYFIARYLIQSNLIQKLGLPSLVLASLLGTSPVFAATQISSPTAPHESSPVLMANLFRRIRETVRDVTDTINTIDSSFPRGNGSNRDNQSPQPQPAPPSARPAPAESPASRPAEALQILHRDDSPTRCQTHTQLTCEAFRISTIPSEGVLVFSYYFNGDPFSFIADAGSEFQVGGGTGISYRVVGVMYGGETAQKRGNCAVTRIGGQYRAALCQAEGGIEFTYTNLN
jgi:hypothetical protein